MLLTAILCFLFMLLMVAAMSIGVLMGRKPIAGTCGGMAALGMNTDCDICGGDPAKCDEESSDVSAELSSETTQYVDASQPKK